MSLYVFFDYCQYRWRYVVPIYYSISTSDSTTKVVNPRAALLSNFEVLTLLRELENDHLARTKTALRIKKEEEASGYAPRPGGSSFLERLVRI
jgi:hypothetical protein